MNEGRSKKAAARRRLLIQLAAVVAALALVLLTVLAMPTVEASADERADAVARRNESQAKVKSLQSEVEGIDKELAAVFTQMEQTKADVAQAEIDLADAEVELAAAQRHLATVQAQLEEAEGELAELASAVDASRGDEDVLTQAVGDMARDLYRGNNVSPLQVVMSTEGTAEISSRAAAASALGRVQSRALDQVRSSLVIQENQQERQAAVTERITVLEQEAEAALATAEEGKAKVEGHMASLESLLQEQKAAEAAWAARKSEAEAQMAASDREAADAAAEIARIDAENAAKQLVIQNTPPQTKPSGGGSGSGGSTTPAPPASGATFAHPFSFRAPVTSNYGWRVHPIFGVPRLHDGVDFGAGCGTPQLATRAGQVTGTGWGGGLGNMVTINHGIVNGSSMVTRHGHLQSIAVSPGQSVSQGQVIGYTGTTGNSTGCHLHLILFVNGSTTNILNYM